MALNICHIIVTYIVLNHTYTHGCVRDSDFTVVKGLLVIVTLFLSDCCGCSLTCYMCASDRSLLSQKGSVV